MLSKIILALILIIVGFLTSMINPFEVNTVGYWSFMIILNGGLGFLIGVCYCLFKDIVREYEKD